MEPIVFIYGAGTFDNYRAALTAAGLKSMCGTELPASPCDGLLLPGGGDIHNILDEAERRLIQSFMERGRPILGICRGMQALNVFFGGTLRTGIPGHQAPEGDLVHLTAAGGVLAQLLGATPVVNSNHHQAVDRLGDGLVICQRATDGIVEGICHETYPILGVQWHPERESYAMRRSDAVDAAPLFQYFARQVRAR